MSQVATLQKFIYCLANDGSPEAEAQPIAFGIYSFEIIKILGYYLVERGSLRIAATVEFADGFGTILFRETVQP